VRALPVFGVHHAPGRDVGHGPCLCGCRLAAERAVAAGAKAPGSLKVGLMDQLYLIKEAEVMDGVKIQPM